MPDKKTESDKLSYPVSPHTLRLPSDKVLDPISYPAFVTTAYKSSDEQSYYIISKEKMQYYMLFFHIYSTYNKILIGIIFKSSNDETNQTIYLFRLFLCIFTIVKELDLCYHYFGLFETNLKYIKKEQI